MTSRSAKSTVPFSSMSSSQVPHGPHAARSDRMSLKSTAPLLSKSSGQGCSQTTLPQPTPAPPNVPEADKQTASSISTQLPSIQQAPIEGVQSTAAQDEPMLWKLPPAALHCTSLVVVQASTPKQHAPARQSTPAQVLSIPRKSPPPLTHSKMSTTEQVPPGKQQLPSGSGISHGLFGQASPPPKKYPPIFIHDDSSFRTEHDPPLKQQAPGISHVPCCSGQDASVPKKYPPASPHPSRFRSIRHRPLAKQQGPWSGTATPMQPLVAAVV